MCKNLVLIVAAIVVNCSYHPFIPPGNIINIDSPGIFEKNSIGISGAYGIAFSLFDYSVLSGWIKADYGLNDKFQVGLSGFGFFLYDSVETYEKYSKYSAGAYASVKYSVKPGLLSVTGGTGFGFSDLGAYSNIDVGAIVGWENRFCVPFVQVNGFVGIPINPKTYDISMLTVDTKNEYLYTPSTTTGIRINGGLKFPVSSWLKCSKQFSISTAIGSATVNDKNARMDFTSMGIKADFQYILSKRNAVGLSHLVTGCAP